jgi:hypothetical protein
MVFFRKIRVSFMYRVCLTGSTISRRNLVSTFACVQISRFPVQTELNKLSIWYTFRYRYNTGYEKVKNGQVFKRLLQYASNHQLLSKFPLAASVLVMNCLSRTNCSFCERVCKIIYRCHNVCCLSLLLHPVELFGDGFGFREQFLSSATILKLWSFS